MQNLHLLEPLAETSLCPLHYFQRLTVPVELAAISTILNRKTNFIADNSTGTAKH